MEYICHACGSSYVARNKPEGNPHCSRSCYSKTRSKDTLIARFWSKVIKEDNCWLWTGSKTLAGYGTIIAGTARTGDKTEVSIYAHRASWEIANGRAIPSGMIICHTCDNPPCVNPDHLFLGTHADNIRDKTAKGRTPKGEYHHAAKLSDNDIRAIRESPLSQLELSSEYEISQSNVSLIKAGKRWKHVV